MFFLSEHTLSPIGCKFLNAEKEKKQETVRRTGKTTATHRLAQYLVIFQSNKVFKVSASKY